MDNDEPIYNEVTLELIQRVMDDIPWFQHYEWFCKYNIAVLDFKNKLNTPSKNNKGCKK